MNTIAKWIIPAEEMGCAVPEFEKIFSIRKEVKKAELSVTAMGTYEASVNGNRVGDFILAPGFTAYDKRLQVQTYDITEMLSEENRLSVLVGKGWYRSRLGGWLEENLQTKRLNLPAALIAWLDISYTDGTEETLITDESWTAEESTIRFSELYDGEICDATFSGTKGKVMIYDGPTETLIPQEGPYVREADTLFPAKIFRTPKGELVIDFGQNLTGYVTCSVNAEKGEKIDLSFAEVLDQNGNFYTDNYRSAECKYTYTCHEGKQEYKPRLTFWGFRYIRVNEFPGGPEKVTEDSFRAVAVHSEMKRTGYLRCSDPLMNQLFENVIWGQKGNFVDVPTDCPQRDERLGWTGDAEVFCRTALMNYDAEKFFEKWLADLAAEQHEDGYVGVVIPDVLGTDYASAAWADAAVIVPWEMYLAFGNREILARQYDSMCLWISYITTHTAKENLWTGCWHYGDWLGLDAEVGSYKGSSREDFIASAYYYYSTSLVIKAGKVLGKDVSGYEKLQGNILSAFRKEYPVYLTQTECVLAVWFGLAEDPQKTADQLAQMIKDSGTQMKTGFVGAAYLLHVLSSYGYTKLAWDLMLRTEYPSWLYPVTKGATTIWEHWDGIMPDGNFWDAEMNSFNHYAYGAVTDWVYAVAAGIMRCENAPGYEKVIIAPHPDERLTWLEAKLETRRGLISSRWTKQENMWRYDIETPVEAEIRIGEESRHVPAGKYTFFAEK